MNTDEHNAWSNAMKAARGRWTIDPIHNGQNSARLLIYCPSSEDHTKGLYTCIYNNGKATAGTFEGAIPHIGEACFAERWQKQFADMSAAFAALATRLGIRYLMAATHGISPFPA